MKTEELEKAKLELLKLKLKKIHSVEDKMRIQKLQQIIEQK